MNQRMDESLRMIRNRIQAQLLRKLETTRELGSTEQVRGEIEDLFGSIVAREGLALSTIERRTLLEEIIAEITGYGPIERLIEDDTITEVMVNGPNLVYIERDGIIEETNITFSDDTSLRKVIDRIVSPLGRHVDEASPFVDARLPDGSRVNIIIPPLSLIGPVITIRKFSKDPLTVNDLIEFGSITSEGDEFLRACVEAKINIVISGGTGTGKTTLLNILSQYIPSRERIVTVEDAAELQLRQKHVIPLEKRPPNVEGVGEVTIRQLVINALRMRPDRIIVGEIRDGAALDMLQAMSTGHEGSLTTVHSNNPRDTLNRIETMVLMAGIELPLRVVREHIASAIEMVVHLERFRDGTRKVVQISEVGHLEGDTIAMEDIFIFEQTGFENERVQGLLLPTGYIPSFRERLDEAGVVLHPRVFGLGWKQPE
jgi:pilus assembly protein CpaF